MPQPLAWVSSLGTLHLILDPSGTSRELSLALSFVDVVLVGRINMADILANSQGTQLAQAGLHENLKWYGSADALLALPFAPGMSLLWRAASICC